MKLYEHAVQTELAMARIQQCMHMGTLQSKCLNDAHVWYCG